jgi:hypothetical protein
VRKFLMTVVALVVVTLALSGCSGSSSDGGSSSKSGTQTVNITIKGNSVTPNGDRIKVKIGEPVILKIDADKAGEIHVHSTPEQHIDFPKGTSTKKLTINTPGIIDVEDHALEKVIVQLEVS